MNKGTNIWLLVVLSTFFWGSNFNAAHALAGSVTPLTAAAERFFLALVTFALLRLWHAKAESPLVPRDFLVLVPLGIIGVFGFNYAFFTALHTTSALNAALIMALSPMVSMLLSVWLLRVTINRAQLVGIIIAFLGVSLVITGGNFAQLKVAVGDLWMLGACAVWSIYSVGSKKFAPHIPALQFARWTVSIGAIALILAALVFEQPLTDLPQLSPVDHSLLIYMSLCGSVLAYIFWLKGVQSLGPDKSAVAFNLVPVFTLLVSIASGHLPNGLQVLGMLLVLSGVIIFTGWRPRWRRQVQQKLSPQ